MVALPLVACEFWFDVRSRGRRLIPELAGALGVSSIAAMIALAGDVSQRLEFGLWLVLEARVVTAIPFVRAQIARLHGRAVARAQVALFDVAAMVLAATAVAVDRPLLAGAVGIILLIVVQAAASRRPVPKVTVIGVRQTLLGLAVVLVTGVGVHVG